VRPGGGVFARFLGVKFLEMRGAGGRGGLDVSMEVLLMPKHRTIHCLAIVSLFALASLLPIAAIAQTGSSFRLDLFGYRPNDQKIVITTVDPGAVAEVRRPDGSVAFRIPADGGSISYRGFDTPRSGDDVWWIDLTPFRVVGEYEIFVSALGESSARFVIGEGVYEDAAQAALKAFYYQRCNTPKPAEFAGAWNDPASCHGSDAATSAAAGHADRGLRDLTGGWHDAGDYNKYVWRAVSDAVSSLLSAYEHHPAVFEDDVLNIPESGNGIPDLLDEIRWELDWLLKMQLADGSVLWQTHQAGFEFSSPPSEDPWERFYHDPTLESGAVFAGTTAHAARVFESVGELGYAATLLGAARDAWGWLQTQGDSDVKAWAAAELFRSDPTATDARNYIDGYSDWSSQWFEIDAYDWRAAATYLRTPGATPATATGMRLRFDAHVDQIFAWNDLYNAGMADWQYYWGSNRPRSLYGLFLLTALELGNTGSYTAHAVRQHALDFLHWMHGRNTLGMLYLTNMRDLGGEHSSYQIFHGWFGNWNDLDSRAAFIGKPAGVTEEDYPYYTGVDNYGVDDDKVSVLGPVPGVVPGGPNVSYGGGAFPPGGEVYYDRAYRDWCDQTIWTALTWEITEPSISYQGPYAALVSYFVRPSGLRTEWRVGPQFNPRVP